MLNGSVTNTSLLLYHEEEIDFTVPEVIIALSVVLILTAILDLSIVWRADTVKRIKKEVGSLKDLQKDYYQLLKQGDEVELRARSFWHLELNSAGIRPQLSEAEKQWVKSTSEVVREADDCVANYNKQTSGFLYGYTALFRLMPIIEVHGQIGKVMSAIDNLFYMKKKDAEKIYRSMDEFRSKYRMLLDRNTIQKNKKSVPAPLPRSSRLTLDRMMEAKDLFSGMEERQSIYLLLPLQVFLNDLHQLQLETETEKSWKAEAEKLSADAKSFIEKFLWWVSLFNKIWISRNINPVATFTFKRHMKHILTVFDELLDRKQRYGFDFIDRAAKHLIFPSAVEDIRSNVEQNSNQVNVINSLLNEMKNKLQEREETAGRNNCLKQIERLSQEIYGILSNSLTSHNSVLELNHFEQIKIAVGRLKKIIDVCTIARGKPTSIVGLKSDIRNLVSKLTATGDDQSILSIVGMAGIGKTTLADEIYHKKTVANHFPVRAWVQVSRKVSETQVSLMREDGTGEQLCIKQVGHRLKENPCLVVIDDVSSTEEWDKLKQLLFGFRPRKRNRILLTTRSNDVALHADGKNTLHQLRLRTKGESWDLFKMVISIPTLAKDVEKLARKVVGRCGGLPLAILSLGCLMLANGVERKVLSAAGDEINQGQNQTPWRQVWLKYSKDLSGTQRNCLYCFTLFPIDYEIPARRLVTLWVAEELVKKDEALEAEDVAERYLEMLRRCYMIQAVQLKSNGKIKTCRLPSMLREFIMRDGIRTSRGQYYNINLQQRFSYHVDDSLDPNLASVFSKKEIPLSVLFFDKREGNRPGEHIGNILSIGIASRQFLEIKVLDLERVFRPQLPEAVSKLIHLKYLGLRWTYLEAIPPFIGKLLNLETLDVKHTYISILPSSIWRLKKLKNLYLNQSYRSKLEGKLSGNSQESLQMLWGVFIDGSSPLLHELRRLKILRKLKMAFQLEETEQELLANQIVQLNQLQSLRLRSIDEMGKPQHLILHDMSELMQLSSLHLFGNLRDQLLVSQLPQSLTDLTLSASKISHDPMQELKRLPKLKSLCLRAESYTGKDIVCSRDSFQELQILRFWKLGNLENWEVQEGAMPNLMEIEIRCCKQLKFPDGLKHLKTLHKIRLSEVPDEFKKDVQQNEKTFWDDIEIVYD